MTGWWRRGSMDNKVHPGPYIDAHLQALRDGANGKQRRSDLIWIHGPSVAALAIALVWGWSIDIQAASLVGIPTGLVAAYLVQFIFQMFDRAAAWADADHEPGQRTSDHGTLLQELNAHGAYAAAVSILAAALTLGAGIHHANNWVEHVLVGLAYAAIIHMVMVLLLIIRRAYLYSDRRLREAKAGEGRQHH